MGAIVATEGFWWLVAASLIAGLVRGFSGFGSGMVLLPATAAFLNPVAAITAMTIADFFGPVPILRRAVRDVYLPDLARLVGAMLVGLPIGVLLLLMLDPTVFRYGVSALALFMLTSLLLGLRYRGKLTPPLVFATGGASGFLGGIVGIPGPPIILLYLASRLPAPVVRATTMLYLFSYDIVLMGLFLYHGRLLAEAVWIGLLLAVPNVLGNLIGAAIFSPDKERVYRAAAYVLIATAAVSGLPLWSD